MTKRGKSIMGKYFGTDGIRGVANVELDAGLAYRAGFAAATVLTKNLNRRAKIYIGRDTRISGDMLEASLAAGICAAGADAALLGVVPTPAVAYLTVAHQADAGIVISASHNPFEHNGVKIFGSQGRKLSDQLEEEVERLIDEPGQYQPAAGPAVGRILRMEQSACREYVAHVAQTSGSLAGLRIAVDCANGAACQTAPELFRLLDADCDFLFCQPDGVNINAGCGSTHLEALTQKVQEGGYDIGVAFDGDADRCLLVDETGQTIDGDQIMGVIAADMKERGALKGGLVATVMSNLGLHAFLKERGVEIATTKVGDRFVLERMIQDGWNIGGEQSGHVILSDYATTGDGELTAATFLQILKRSGKKASQLAGQIRQYPQKTVNVPVPNDQKKTVGQRPEVQAVEQEIARLFGQDGRILIRPSGTEALVRVMVEGKDDGLVKQMVQKAAKVIESIYAQ